MICAIAPKMTRKPLKKLSGLHNAEDDADNCQKTKHKSVGM